MGDSFVIRYEKGRANGISSYKNFLINHVYPKFRKVSALLGMGQIEIKFQTL